MFGSVSRGSVVVRGDDLSAVGLEQHEARRRQDEPDGGADRDRRAAPGLRFDDGVAEPQADDGVLPERLVGIDFRRGTCRAPCRHDVEQVGPDAENEAAPAMRGGLRELRRQRDAKCAAGEASVHELARQQVHRRIADETRDANARRPRPDLLRCPDLLDRPLRDDGDPVADRKRLHRIRRAPHRRRGPRRDEDANLAAQLVSELRIEMRDRLVEQRHQRLLHEDARQRHALLLAPRQLRRQPRAEMPDFEKLEQRVDSRLVASTSVRRDERRHDIVAHRHMRIERIGFEHVGDVPPARRDPVDIALGDAAVALVGRLEAGDDPAQRRFAGSRRSGHGEHLARPRRERHRLQGGDRTEILGYAAQLEDRAGAGRGCAQKVRMRVHAATSRLRPCGPANRWM